MQKNKLFLFILILGCFIKTKAQVVIFGDSTDITKLTLNECGKPDTITIFVRVVTGSLNNPIELNDTFLSNFIYTGFVPSTAILGSTGQGTNLAKLSLNASVINSAGTGVRLQLLIRAKCGSNGLSSASHGLLLSAGGGFLRTVKGKDFVSSIKAPTLILEARNNVNVSNAEIDSTYTRRWRIRNTGTNSEVDTIWFRSVYQAQTQFVNLRVGGTLVSPTTIVGDTVWYRIIRNFRNQSNFPGDTVIVEERFKVTACTNPSSSSTVSTYWGCLNSPVCNIDDRYPATQVPLTVPNMTARLVSTKYGCYGDYDTVTIAYINSGLGNATNLQLRFDLNYPIVAYQNDPDIAASIAFIDTASIVSKTGANGSYVRDYVDSAVRYDNNRSFWPVSNPIGIAYLNRSFVKAGDTVYVQFRRFRGLYNNDYCQATEIYTNYHIWYKNNCGTVSYYTPMTNIFGSAHRHYGKVNYNGPSYMQNGFVDSALFTFSTLRGAGFSHFNQANDYFVLRLTLPPGLVWRGDTSISRMTQAGSNYSKKVDSSSYNPSTRILELYYRNIDRFNSLFSTVKLHLDCSVPGAGGTQSLTVQYFNVRMIDRCGFQRLPFSCADAYPITMICPGTCPRGGIVPTFSQFRRNTYGLPDNNNDGIPDPSGSLDFTKIEWNKLAPRDTFTLTYKGYIARGSQSPAQFTNGYGSIYIPQYSDMISIVDGSITIFDFSSSTSFTVNNLPTTRLDTGTRSRITFDFSNTVVGFPGGYIFDSGDSFTFRGRFVFNRNVIEGGGVTDNTVTTTNSFYVSHLVNPTNDTARYRCIDLPANYRVVQVYKGYNGGFVNRAVGCNTLAVYSDFFQSVGDCCGNYAGSVHFPNEYRLFTTCDTLRIRIPAGYVLDSTRITYVYTAGAGKAGSINFYNNTPTINGEWYTFPIGNRFTTNGGSFVPSTTGSYFVMYNFVKPSCALPVGNVQQELTSDRWIGRGTWNGISVRGVAPNHNRGTYEYTEAANLDLSNLGATTQLGINKTVFWDVKLQNSAVNANATNTWLGFRSNSNQIIVDSVRNLATNALMPQTNGIFRLGNLGAGGAIANYRIYAKYNICVFDSLTVYTGWTCSAYPSNLSSATGSCRSDSVRTFIQPLNPLVQTDLIAQPPNQVNLCDTLNWIVSVSNRQVAAAYDVTLDVIFPDGGVGNSIIPSFGYKYPFNVASFTKITPINMGGGVYRFYLSDSIAALRANGLRPIDESPNNELLVNVRALTNCNFTSGSSVRFLVNSKKACNVPLTPDAEFDPIFVIGSPVAKLHLGGSIETPITTCDQDFTVRVSVRNFELSKTGTRDNLYVTLPSGAVFVSGSTNFTRNPFLTTTPTISTLPNGQQRLRWVMDSIPRLDSSVLSFRLRSPSNTICGNVSTITVSTRSTYTAVCGLGTCNSEVLNWEESDNMPVQKPDIRFITGTMYIYQDTTAGNIWFNDTIIASDITFTNFGNDTAEKVYIKFFHDLNGNKIHDLTELVWSFDTLYNVLPNETRKINWTKTYPHNTVPDSLRLAINSKCNCTQTNFSATPFGTYVPLEINLFDFTAYAKQGLAQLNWSVNNTIEFKGFEVQRKNLSTQFFEKIGFVTVPKSDWGGIAKYEFTEPLGQFQVNAIEYRIKAIQKSGKTALSPIRVIQLNKNAGSNLTVQPNPNQGAFTVQFNAEVGNRYQIDLMDITGKLLKQDLQSGIVLQENNQIFIQLDKNLKGIYLIRLMSGNSYWVTKLFIE